MKIPWFLVVAAVLLFTPGAAAFTYSHGENRTIYPRCVNATDGAFFGSNANLTVRNETGVFYVVDALPNQGAGLFTHEIHNLSLGHCYGFDLGCEDAGSWRNEWATVCVNQSTTQATITGLNTGFSDLGAVFGMLFGAVLMAGFAYAFGQKWPVLLYFFIPVSLAFLLLGVNTALKAAEGAGAAAGVTSSLETSLWLSVTILIISAFGMVVAAWHGIMLWMSKRSEGDLG